MSKQPLDEQKVHYDASYLLLSVPLARSAVQHQEDLSYKATWVEGERRYELTACRPISVYEAALHQHIAQVAYLSRSKSVKLRAADIIKKFHPTEKERRVKGQYYDQIERAVKTIDSIRLRISEGSRRWVSMGPYQWCRYDNGNVEYLLSDPYAQALFDRATGFKPPVTKDPLHFNLSNYLQVSLRFQSQTTMKRDVFQRKFALESVKQTSLRRKVLRSLASLNKDGLELYDRIDDKNVPNLYFIKARFSPIAITFRRIRWDEEAKRTRKDPSLF